MQSKTAEALSANNSPDTTGAIEPISVFQVSGIFGPRFNVPIIGLKRCPEQLLSHQKMG